MKKLQIEIENKKSRENIIFQNVTKALVFIGLLIKKFALHAALHIGSLFEKDVEYGASKMDQEIVERIIHDRDKEFQNEERNK
ncbi:MAG: hypothetical protein NT150_04805 [Bacteroidetes bacterium]|nr:hypothetical protein [Bacteroidota bacterium]